jgi:multidrug efflux pump subunit AcrA (membrane-fusion protein)
VTVAPGSADLAVPDESPVTVAIVRDAVEDALAVPLEAVAATPGGAFALEVVAADGSTRMVPVELGREADGWVQVTGSVEPGQTVVTA